MYPAQLNSFFYQSTKEWSISARDFTNNFRFSKTLGYESIPNAAYFNFNSLGMRDRERSLNKPVGIYRIICIGDSTTGHSEYTQILEQMLNHNTHGYEVWNCGVMGYGLFQYGNVLKEKWLYANPDMVIVGFCLNDFTNTPLVVIENHMLVGYFPKKEIVPQMNIFLFKHSALYRFIMFRIIGKYKGKAASLQDDFDYYINDIKNILFEKKVDLLFVILGLPQRLSDYPPYFKESYYRIKNILEYYKIPYLDMVPIFEQYSPLKLMKAPGDYLHFNYLGSTIVAEAIYSYFQNKHR